jgi:hypothetical protein
MIRRWLVSSSIGALTLLASLAGAVPALAHVTWPS